MFFAARFLGEPMMTLWQFLRLLSVRLLRWSLLSVLVGVLFVIGKDIFWSGFGLQAIVWGIVDGVIATFGWRSAGRKEAELMTWEQVGAEARKLRRILWINAGLDILYIAGGMALILKLGADSLFWSGTGWGIVVQGAFLLFFDTFHAHQINGEHVEI